MKNTLYLESDKNFRIKNIINLISKARERKSQGLFLVEGVLENLLAIRSKHEAIEFYIYKELFNSREFELDENKNIIYITKNIFEKIAYRKTTGGIIGLYKSMKNDLTMLENTVLNKIIVLEAVEKPGNLGAILRTADAAKMDAVIICDPLVDFYNPNVVRSSVGAVFTNQLIVAKKQEIVSFLNQRNIQIVATYLNDETENIYNVDLSKPTAIVLGTEALGLSDYWLSVADVCVKIPMIGQIDSLNVSNAAAIAVFELLRQQKFNKR